MLLNTQRRRRLGEEARQPLGHLLVVNEGIGMGASGPSQIKAPAVLASAGGGITKKTASNAGVIGGGSDPSAVKTPPGMIHQHAV